MASKKEKEKEQLINNQTSEVGNTPEIEIPKSDKAPLTWEALKAVLTPILKTYSLEIVTQCLQGKIKAGESLDDVHAKLESPIEEVVQKIAKDLVNLI